MGRAVVLTRLMTGDTGRGQLRGRGAWRRAALAATAALITLTATALTGHSTATAAPPPSCGPSDPIGTRLPVLFVHGFNSTAATWKHLNDFCTTQTYATTFDYGPESNEWVTNPNIGPALAGRILTLANASRRDGGPGKVFVVAHSMGGLAVRCAADGRCAGLVAAAPAGQASQVAQDLAGVVTFDTPNTGSFARSNRVADTFGKGLDGLCYADQVAYLGLNSILNGVCEELRVLATSDASRAFVPGSPELAALPSQPAGVPVMAIAAQTHMLLHLLFATVHITTGDPGDDGTGDLIVAEQSAQAQTRAVGLLGGTATFDCGTLNIGATLAWSGVNCWHSTETNDARFLSIARQQIAHWLDQQAAATAPWTAPVLLITPTSLGAVHLGMNLPQAEAAAHDTFTVAGDGEYSNSLGLPLDPAAVEGGIRCLGARISNTGVPVVMTAEGFKVGDSIAALKNIYGSRLTYVNRQGGYAPTVGYVLTVGDALLLFEDDGAGHIREIAAAHNLGSTIAC